MSHPVFFHMNNIDKEKTNKLMIAGCSPDTQKQITQLKRLSKRDLEYLAIKFNISSQVKKQELLNMLCEFIVENNIILELESFLCK